MLPMPPAMVGEFALLSWVLTSLLKKVVGESVCVSVVLLPPSGLRAATRWNGKAIAKMIGRLAKIRGRWVLLFYLVLIFLKLRSWIGSYVKVFLTLGVDSYRVVGDVACWCF